jgi:2-oxoglutarate dehydrogenase complex dehydrogenase (E1) component-like enzyme
VRIRKKATVAIVPDQSSTSAPTEADFGANDWLLEEMYEQYTADPNSVDETWAEYFKDPWRPSQRRWRRHRETATTGQASS